MWSLLSVAGGDDPRTVDQVVFIAAAVFAIAAGWRIPRGPVPYATVWVGLVAVWVIAGATPTGRDALWPVNTTIDALLLNGLTAAAAALARVRDRRRRPPAAPQ